LLAKGPDLRCAATATTIVPATAIGPKGSAMPVAVNTPPATSDTPARVAICRAGASPMRPKPWLVASSPRPPNHPNNFCAPWAAMYPPSTTRAALIRGAEAMHRS